MDTSKPKPNLMAASSTAGGGKRILAHLEHGARPAARPVRATGWTIDGWTVSLGVLLLLMCSVAWMMHEKKITPSTYKHGEGRSRAAATTPRIAIPATPTEQAAAIVNEAPMVASAPLEGASENSVAHSAMQAAAQPAVQSAAEMPRGTQAGQRPIQAGASAPSRAALAAAAQQAAAAHNAAAQATRDTDVTLLTALVAHANKPTVTMAERSRDVVERQEGDSTAQLLARCQQLGVIEGMLCRSRICAGRWDTDAACRAPAH